MLDLEMKQGWAIEITRDDGTTFLASTGVGDGPAVWCKRNRKYAVQHKKKLREEGRIKRCRVVSVYYFEPIVERLYEQCKTSP